MATISNTPRPGYVWDATDNVWYPIGVGGHSHGEIPATIADAKGDLIVGTAADTVDRLAVGADATILVADSTASTGLKQYWLGQIIEGNNFESFQFGTASAQTITVSFWVKSNITGTFGFAIRNSSADRSYVSTYTISAANTWEKKTITIAGDTSGTWVKDSGIGARMEWVLNAGTDYQTSSPNSWTASNDMTTSSQTNLFATLSNSFQLTAVQVEAGSVATAFQTATGTIQGELAACQRYYFRFGGSSNYQRFANGLFQSSTQAWTILEHPVPMRANPTATDWSSIALFDGNSVMAITSLVAVEYAPNATGLLFAVASGSAQYRPAQIFANNTTSAYLGLSAEL
jgi:hypothetical protein